MAAMAKGFIDMDSLDGKIREYLVAYEDELEQWLQSPEVQVLSIMEEQFKYINLFGALLGFCIGLINLVLLQFI